MSFAPIAIVGRAVLLPGVTTPESLWETVIGRQDHTGPAPASRWGVADRHILTDDPDHSADRAWSKVGGYVRDFQLDPSGFELPAEALRDLDPVFQWALHTGRQALQGVRRVGRTGAVMGNLSFPSAGLSRFAESVWLSGSSVDPAAAGVPASDPRNRFSSGLPAHVLAQALGLDAGAMALDAACASSLYAIKLAADALHRGEADLMLAGAVNSADDLFIHVGFCALSALSRTGQSRPFHAQADGLIPGEGAGFVALKRLDDAIAHGDTIYGVIRGVGLSNDGRGRGLLVPTQDGQARAIADAYRVAGLRPDEIDYVECHATGTTVGDATELHSMGSVHAGRSGVPIGSLKGNLGHLITAAGVAGLIKVLSAFEHKTLPPTPHLGPQHPELAASPFRVLTAPEAWPSAGRPRRAGVSAFGFGGNNSHLVVEEWTGTAPQIAAEPLQREPIAIVAMGARVGDGQSTADLAATLFDGRPLNPRAELIAVPLRGLRFPPRDLEQALGQQTMLLAAAMEAVAGVTLPTARTSVLIGMGCDAEVARYGARWRAAEWADTLGLDAAWAHAAREGIIPVLESPGVLGTMPNIPANRINSQLDLAGPSFTVSGEELSGLLALKLASEALQAREIDAALVGASDLSSEPAHQAAAHFVLPADRQRAGDAAVVLVLKRLSDAQAAGDDVLALLSDEPLAAGARLGLAPGAASLTELLGHAHAASGLVHLAAAALFCRTGRAPGVEVRVDAIGGQSFTTWVRPAGPPAAIAAPRDLGPVLRMSAHRPAPAVPAAPGGSLSSNQTMAPAPMLPPVSTAVSFAAPTVAAAPPSPVAQASLATVVGESDAYARLVAYQRQLAAIHQQFLAQQSSIHQRFLQVQQQALFGLVAGQAAAPDLGKAPMSALAPAWAPAPVVVAPAPVAAAPAPVATKPVTTVTSLPTHAPAPKPMPVAAKPVATVTSAPKPAAKPAPAKKGPAEAQPYSTRGGLHPVTGRPLPVGPTFSREQLKIDASGKISELFGPLFEQQDGWQVQVRMPEPPLLLADRVTGLDAEAGSMGRGTIWTESDVKADSWYLNHGYMPAGILIESGQADLMLISYLGIDFFNKGERAYRLLGCELTYHGSLPTIGDTISYDIHVDGHAKHGDIRLFFFHYDCMVNHERPMLSVREGQAGFFTRAELDDSDGILWTPEEQEVVTKPRLAAPAVRCTRSSFSSDQLEAFAQGDGYACFGPGFELLQPHNRTPRIQGGKMRFLDQITEFNPQGGPWKRGYLKAVSEVRPDLWFFDGHFKGDPCMPGTLMFEGCLQMMAFYVAAMGFTIPRDGWRFEPIPDEAYKLLCRGQVLPENKELIYEIFVEEVIDGPIPMLYADVLCTCDGLKGFHARRMGLRLVPDWPITSVPELLDGYVEPKPVAKTPEGFAFDYASLMACAWNKPSKAFGSMYSVFDTTRKVARLPGPPYHFMSRVPRTDGLVGECKPGATIEIEYDIPPAKEWYFVENGAPTMPFCVFLEAALQPCGWLASFVGSAVTTDKDLMFRNLDGTGNMLIEIPPSGGTLRTIVTITNISMSAGMIIESFDVECILTAADGSEAKAYDLKTVFGFFPPEAFLNQVGLPIGPEHRDHIDGPSNLAVDLTKRPASCCEGPLRLPQAMLLMIDRVTRFDRDGGKAGLGLLRAEKDVDPSEWFFKAHFYQDPVQPGSLGIEAMIQLLQYYMIETGMGEGVANPRFEPLLLGKPMTWKYRGQVVPTNKLISSTVEIVEVGEDDKGRFAIAEASLWVDGKRIYEAKNLGMRIVSGSGDDMPPHLKMQDESVGAPRWTTVGHKGFDLNLKGQRVGGSSSSSASSRAPKSATADDEGDLEVLSPDGWLADHCPTWTVPALPLMSMIDRLIAAACPGELPDCVQLADIAVHRWVPVAHPTRVRTVVDGDQVRLDVWRAASDPRLSRFEPAASGTVLPAHGVPRPVPLPPLTGGRAVANPYGAGLLFHGPAFQHLTQWVLGSDGASAILDAAPRGVPVGVTHQGLLDAITHAIPHDRLSTWSKRIDDDMVAYPYRVTDGFLWGRLPTTGTLHVEIRFDGFDDNSARFPAMQVQARHEGQVVAAFRLVEILLPKGPLGSAMPKDRLTFLRDRRHVAGLALSTLGPDTATVTPADVRASNWLPGTILALYGSEDPGTIAVRDAVGQASGSHPSLVYPVEHAAFASPLPLTRWPVEVRHDGDAVTASLSAAPALDLSSVRSFWAEYFGLSEWPVEDIYYGLAERFVGEVHLENPAAFRDVQGRSVIFLANHQVGIESLLFSIIASALNGVTTVTLAKDEHRRTWLGNLIRHCFQYPGIVDPRVITYFDRSDKASLPSIIGELAREMVSPGKNVLVHVEGTRGLDCRTPVQKMSSAFVDMALAVDAPIVPVRFVGGLPTTPLDARIEFPIGMGKQDYWFGTPILPKQLGALPYKERKDLVMESINALGVRAEAERPSASDDGFAERVEAWAQRSRATHEHATLYQMLAERSGNSIAALDLLAAARGDTAFNDDPVGSWMTELARRLGGSLAR